MVFLVFLVIFPLPSVSAVEEFADAGSTGYDWVQVIENSTVFAYDDDGKRLHIVDLETMHVIQNVTCSKLGKLNLAIPSPQRRQ